MPPVRTVTASKPMKTERTHEENQERAYIAASRRSDRSLEARVESARRASEIHKRRTGRSLRVTEQDVINEEMYEEEDDDLPMQYRRLTAHLQTTNADFDRRLAAYLTNHVAMRTALGQAVSDTYAHQQYPKSAQFANPMAQYQQASFPTPDGMIPQMTTQSPHMYRQSPYPTPNGQQAYHPSVQGRSSSMVTPQPDTHNYSQQHGGAVEIKKEDPRTSLPANGPSAAQSQNSGSPIRNVSPAVSRTSSSSNLANLKHEAAQQGFFQPGAQRMSPPQMPSQQQTHGNASMRPSMFPAPFSFDHSSGSLGLGSPFSTSLPLESQQLLGGGAFDLNDPMTAMLMGGQARPQQPFYSYNPNGSFNNKKSFNNLSTFEGMNQTLAPGVLDVHAQNNSTFNVSPTTTSDSAFTPFTPGGFGMCDPNTNDVFKPQNFFSSGNSSNGEVTPNAERDWQNLMEANLWDEQSSSQTAAA